MSEYYLFELSPNFARIGPIGIGWYVVMFAAALAIGTALWLWQMRRGGYDMRRVSRFVAWAAVAVIVGARLGHVLLYHPVEYLSHPVSILRIWEGGMASHGVFVSMFLVFLWFARRGGHPVLDVFDRFMPSAAAGSACVRVGNFLNSEIVGRPSDVPWAVRFMYYDSGTRPRHPVQLYEAALLVAVFAAIVITDRIRREERPHGLLTGLFLCLYFLGRFFLEFFKKPLKFDDTAAVTMGQYLSIVPFAFGCLLLGRIWWISRRR